MEQPSGSAPTSNAATPSSASPPAQESIAERLANRLGNLSLTKHKSKSKVTEESASESESSAVGTASASPTLKNHQRSQDLFSELPPLPFERELPAPPPAVAAAPYPSDYAAAVMRSTSSANNLRADAPSAGFTFAQASASTSEVNNNEASTSTGDRHVDMPYLQQPQQTTIEDAPLPSLPPRPNTIGSNSSSGSNNNNNNNNNNTRLDVNVANVMSTSNRSNGFYYPSSTISTPTTAAATVHAHAQGSGLARVHSVSPPNNRAQLIPPTSGSPLLQTPQHQQVLRTRPASSVGLTNVSSLPNPPHSAPAFSDHSSTPPPLQVAPTPRPMSYTASNTTASMGNTFLPEGSSGSTEPQMVFCRCAFCYTELKYYDVNRCFSCTVCDTVNDLDVHISSRNQSIRQQTSPLELDWLQAGPGDDEAGYARRIYLAFSNWDILNASFSNGRESSVVDTGLLMNDLRQGYRIIMSQPRAVIRAMMSGIDKLLRRIGRPIRTTQELKFIMILLENPVLNASGHQPKEAEQRHAVHRRLFGLIGFLANDLHHCLVSWFSQLPKDVFLERVEMINRFITFRLQNQHRYQLDPKNFSLYDSDWPTSAGARVMALFFSANKQRTKIELHDFYNTLADYIDLQRDFDLWRRTTKRFCFCQYPFLLSIGARMRIMEVEAQRQMQHLADSAVYNTLCGHQPTVPYLVLRVRREYLIEDSLNQLAQLRRDFKKKLRIEFVGELGIDAGGLTKEWFLLLVRELFSPDYGMFTCDEDSGLIWFNPASFESSDQYYLVGVIIGLAIYNSTILDIRLPLACYKKLLGVNVGLSDLAQFRPAFAHGLRQLLEYKGDDVEEVFGLDFVAQYEAFGEIQLKPLVPDGEGKPVTRRTRREYVERYIDFILNTSMNDQFVAFKRGFDEVCDGATIKLFRPEEIELVVRGSADSLQLTELRAVTVYDGFRDDEQIINNFWNIFMSADPTMQRRILFFITGSDRVPATGMSNMVFKITCIGSDCERYPQAHTCFNQLCLYRYRNRQKLYDKLITAVMESEGYGLK